MFSTCKKPDADVTVSDYRGNTIVIPYGAKSCAMKVVSFTPGEPWTKDPTAMNPESILGLPDCNSTTDANYVTLGDGGVIVLEFGVHITNGNGNDIYVFDVGADKIEVLIHPQSIIHSMVQFIDGAIIAQLGEPDMRVPIQYALTYPQRAQNNFPRVDFMKLANGLTFFPPDFINFPCLKIAYDALKQGGAYPCIMNAANEIAVERFLNGEIGFNDISCLIERTISAYNHYSQSNGDIEEIIAADSFAREHAMNLSFN